MWVVVNKHLQEVCLLPTSTMSVTASEHGEQAAGDYQIHSANDFTMIVHSLLGEFNGLLVVNLAALILYSPAKGQKPA